MPSGLICLLCLGGCTTSPQKSLAHSGYAHKLPSSVVLDDTPFFPQTDYQCGPAALATVLQAQGIEATPGSLSPQVYLPARKGSLQVEMIATARRHHTLPYLMDASFSALLAEVAAGNPVLVLQNLGLNWLPVWHYAVVVGYDLDRGVLILRSGTLRERQTSISVFKRTWKRSANWALVIVPAGIVPVTATISAYLKTAHAFEETGQTAQAVMAYRAATTRWPGQSEAWLMSGNMAFAGGRIDESVADFLRATRLSPGDIRAWNNLAYALQKQGCAAQAKTALRCALQLAPGDRNLLDSLRDIEQPAPGKQGKHCEMVHCPVQ